MTKKSNKKFIKITNKYFEGTSILRKYIDRKIRNSYPLYSKIHPRHQRFIKELIRFYYLDQFVDSIAAITVNIPKDYKRQKNTLVAHSKYFKSKTLNIRRSVEEAGLFFVKGYTRLKKQANAKVLREQKQTALRMTVNDQIREFRLNFEQQYPNYDFSDYQVHHIDPEFQTLVDNWMKSRGITWNDLEIYYDRGQYVKLSNQALAKDFKEYHQQVATLTYIPRKENLRLQQRK